MHLLPTLLTLLPLTLAALPKSTLLAQSNSSPNGIITLDSASYEELIKSTPGEPRDYSLSVLLTALPPQYKCQPCHVFDPAYKMVANSWKKQPSPQRENHFFAQLDFQDGQAVYQKLGLQTAPTMQFFGAKAGEHKSNLKQDHITYDFSRNGFEVDAFHTWTSTLTPRPFPLLRPFSLLPYILLPLLTISTLLGLYLSYPYLIPLFQNKLLWQGGSLFAILVFTSGHMWNRIRNAPYSAANGQSIAQGFSQQYVLETQIVAFLYGILAFSTIALAIIAPSLKGSIRQRFAIYIWVGVLVFVFSILVRVFKVKNGGYPFKMLLG